MRKETEYQQLGESSHMKDQFVLKICSSGTYQVGKTSLIRRYAENTFTTNYMPTIGVDITSKVIDINNQKVKLILHDTAGQEVFGRLRRFCYEGSVGCIIVYDITRRPTFENLEHWIQDYRNIQGEEKPIVIIGNKIDLEDLRQVSTKEGEEFAKSVNLPFYECSAKVGGDVISQIYLDLINDAFSLVFG
ncbi:MAG: Rab family GTPase [Candidatus Hodarchaeales archaeon]|jgi:small GTP-binding protein